MALQVLPPELTQTEDRIETKEPQPYWKPSSLSDGESEEFRLLGCYETAVMLRLAIFVLTATSSLALILGSQMTLPEKPTGPNQIDLKSMARLSSLDVS
jgi:hypothetical protein